MAAVYFLMNVQHQGDEAFFDVDYTELTNPEINKNVFKRLRNAIKSRFDLNIPFQIYCINDEVSFIENVDDLCACYIGNPTASVLSLRILPQNTERKCKTNEAMAKLRDVFSTQTESLQSRLMEIFEPNIMKINEFLYSPYSTSCLLHNGRVCALMMEHLDDINHENMVFAHSEQTFTFEFHNDSDDSDDDSDVWCDSEAKTAKCNDPKCVDVEDPMMMSVLQRVKGMKGSSGCNHFLFAFAHIECICNDVPGDVAGLIRLFLGDDHYVWISDQTDYSPKGYTDGKYRWMGPQRYDCKRWIGPLERRTSYNISSMETKSDSEGGELWQCLTNILYIGFKIGSGKVTNGCISTDEFMPILSVRNTWRPKQELEHTIYECPKYVCMCGHGRVYDAEEQWKWHVHVLRNLFSLSTEYLQKHFGICPESMIESPDEISRKSSNKSLRIMKGAYAKLKGMVDYPKFNGQIVKIVEYEASKRAWKVKLLNEINEMRCYFEDFNEENLEPIPAEEAVIYI